jgi:hypothetical protein
VGIRQNITKLDIRTELVQKGYATTKKKPVRYKTYRYRRGAKSSKAPGTRNYDSAPVDGVKSLLLEQNAPYVEVSGAVRLVYAQYSDFGLNCTRLAY